MVSAVAAPAAVPVAPPLGPWALPSKWGHSEELQYPPHISNLVELLAQGTGSTTTPPTNTPANVPTSGPWSDGGDGSSAKRENFTTFTITNTTISNNKVNSSSATNLNSDFHISSNNCRDKHDRNESDDDQEEKESDEETDKDKDKHENKPKDKEDEEEEEERQLEKEDVDLKILLQQQRERARSIRSSLPPRARGSWGPRATTALAKAPAAIAAAPAARPSTASATAAAAPPPPTAHRTTTGSSEHSQGKRKFSSYFDGPVSMEQLYQSGLQQAHQEPILCDPPVRTLPPGDNSTSLFPEQGEHDWSFAVNVEASRSRMFTEWSNQSLAATGMIACVRVGEIDSGKAKFRDSRRADSPEHLGSNGNTPVDSRSRFSTDSWWSTRVSLWPSSLRTGTVKSSTTMDVDRHHTATPGIGRWSRTQSQGDGRQGKQLLGEFLRQQTNGTGVTGAMSTISSTPLSEKIISLLSFEDQPGLLRGSYVSDILRRQAALLKNNKGNISTYDMSHETDHIDTFLSHNWDTPRWQKFLCLALHFNLVSASCATFLLMALFAILGHFDRVPVHRFANEEQPRGYLCRLLAAPFFLFWLFFCRDVIHSRCWRGPMLFLDKTCISQEDPELQARCISKLGAFLCYSKTMLICYTDLYLRRLWTVYEVASFLSLYPVEKIKVIPPFVPILFVSAVSLLYLLNIVGFLATWYSSFLLTDHVGLPILCYAFLTTCRNWARDRGSIKERLRTFEVEKCACFLPSDRTKVCANIADLMKQTQGLSINATDDQALAYFDKMVREELPIALSASLGKFSMRYQYMVLTMVATYVPRVCDMTAAHLPAREMTSYLLRYLIAVFCGGPTCYVLLDAVAHSKLHWQGCREHALVILGSLLCGVYTAALLLAMDRLSQWAGSSGAGLAVYLMVVVVYSLSIAAFVLQPKFLGDLWGRFRRQGPFP